MRRLIDIFNKTTSLPDCEVASLREIYQRHRKISPDVPALPDRVDHTVESYAPVPNPIPSHLISREEQIRIYCGKKDLPFCIFREVCAMFCGDGTQYNLFGQAFTDADSGESILLQIKSNLGTPAEFELILPPLLSRTDKDAVVHLNKDICLFFFGTYGAIVPVVHLSVEWGLAELYLLQNIIATLYSKNQALKLQPQAVDAALRGLVDVRTTVR